jgi:superfamily II DNA or RNA helicase
MILKAYKWQSRLVRIYRGSGVVKAFAGTGKTYAAILLIKDRNYKKAIVAVPTRKLRNQWIEELDKNGLNNVLVVTFHILSKPKSKGLKCDILVVDECHRSVSPVFQKLYKNINYKHVLGLSATPNKKSLDYCGNIIIEVPLEKAQIADFTVYFHAIPLNQNEKNRYDELSESIRKLLGRMRSCKDDSEKWRFREKLDYMIFRRRSVVYSAEARIPYAINLIKDCSDNPTLIICKRIEQANKLSKITGYPVYHSENPDEKALDDFQNDRIPVLLSVGMLSEGYDKRNIGCLIIVSTAITESYHIQSIGRAVRLPYDAEIHILLARNTTDEKLLQFRDLYKHEIFGNFSKRAFKPKNPWIEHYYLGDEFFIDTEGRIFQKTDNGKIFFKDNIISSTLQRVLNYRAGKFRITREGLVLIKVGGKITSVGLLQEPLEKIKPRKLNHLSKKSS